MAKIQQFEDLEIWQKSMDIAVSSYNLLKYNSQKLEYPIKEQIIKSSLSISNNIAEGFEYNSNNQFVRFLKIAKGSAGELRNQFHFLNQINYIEHEEFEKYLTNTKDISKQISSFIKYLKNFEANK
jgi:four helix bundle protein